MTRFWLAVRLCYYIVAMLTFVTFPAIVISGAMPASIALLCYIIAGLCALMFVADVTR